jgi:hypothetical protein
LIRPGGAEGAVTVGRVLMLGLLGSMEAVNDDGVPYVLEGRRLGRVDSIHSRSGTFVRYAQHVQCRNSHALWNALCLTLYADGENLEQLRCVVLR